MGAADGDGGSDDDDEEEFNPIVYHKNVDEGQDYVFQGEQSREYGPSSEHINDMVNHLYAGGSMKPFPAQGPKAIDADALSAADNAKRSRVGGV